MINFLKPRKEKSYPQTDFCGRRIAAELHALQFNFSACDFHILVYNMADQANGEASQEQEDGSAEAKVTLEEAIRNEVSDESKIQPATANSSTSKKSAKKKKKGKKAEGATAAVATATNAEQGPSKQSDSASAAVNMKTLRQIQRAVEQMMVGDKPARTKNEARQRKYQFWDTQPVPKIGKETIIMYNISKCQP